MIIKSVQLEVLKEFAQSIDNSELLTKSQKKKFSFNSDEKGFYYTPASTDKSRFQSYFYINRFLERYNEIKSLAPKDYLDITVNASYLLAIIREYLVISNEK